MLRKAPYGKRVMQTLGRFGLDTFILLLMGMIVFARLFPQGGIGDGPWSLSSLSGYGVSMIFFFYGLKLNFQEMKKGIFNWKLHAVVHTSTFILFPLLVLSCKWMFDEEAYLFWLGTFFLASLPSTVSSSVVMVSIAEGNIPAAIFNASISSIIGVFITPVWMGVVNMGSNGGTHLGDIILKLTVQVVVPVSLGLLLNKKWGHWAEKHKKQLKYFDQSIILVIVYTAFCESFAQNLFSNIRWFDLVILCVCMLVLFFIAFLITRLACKMLSFNREDSITATFCGSKKSLIHGTVMSKVLFVNNTTAGVLLLPLMLYHALQLIVVSMIAQRMAKDKSNITKIDDPGGAVTI